MQNPKIFYAWLLCTIFSVHLTYSQELTGKELRKSDDLNALMESGIGLIFGSKDIVGEINTVTVTADAHNKLSVKIVFEGFENRWMKGSILNAEKAKIDELESSPIEIAEGETEKEMVFQLNSNATEESYESILLKILVCKRETDATGKVFAYNLSKEWKLSGLSVDEEPQYDFINEDLVLNVNPVPVGSAVQLKDAQPNYIPKPNKTLRIKVDNSIYKSKVERKPMAFQAVPMKKSTTNTSTASKTTKPTSTAKMKTQRTFTRAQMQKIEVADKKEDEPPVYQLRPVQMQPLQLSKEQVEKGAKGPGNSAISLWDEIYSDVNFDFGSTSITNINTDIFPDINEHSGYYYYVPASYSLKWDKDDSYELKILYGSAGESGAANVNMFVQLTPAVGTQEKKMVEKLVKDYTQKNNLPYEKLLPVPLASEPFVDLSAQLSNLYDVPADKVATMVSGLFDPIEVAWPMGSKKADDLMVGLKEVDLNGSLKLAPQGEMPEISLPVRISLDNENVLGRIELKKNSWRNSNWKNEMPFPVKLKYIHALILNKEEQGGTVPFVYSWSLNNTEVPVLASVKMNANAIPKLVDSKAQRIWIEYSVPDCMDCKDKVLNELTGGTTTARQQNVEVVSYVKERTGAYVIEVKLRSRFADTKGENIIELSPLKIAEDGESYYLGPLLVPEGERLEYEYRLKLVTDEEVLQSDWIYSSESSLYINKKMITDALGKFPGE